MKRILLILVPLLVMFTFSSCNIEDVLDAIGSFDDVKEDFAEIAEKTGGEQIEAQGAKELPEKILEIIQPASGKIQTGSDVVFCIDKTGSMRNDIDEVKASLSTILSSADASTMFAITTFGDKNNDGAEWFAMSGTETTTDTSSLQSFVNAIETTGGGDWPESVYDALWETMDQIQWQSQSQRIIILMGDASPLTGDKTTYTLDDVVSKSREDTPNINVFTIAIDND